MSAAAMDPPTNASGNRPVVSMRDVHMLYHLDGSDVAALQGVDFDVYPGEMVVLLGPSGSGKSTLLNLLGGLDRPTRGEINYFDAKFGDADDEAITDYRRRRVGFVFQFYNLIPSLTALENVRLITEIAANPLTPEESLELVGMTGRAYHFPAQLSGGEQQRVAIARAIAKRPDILLCDEPTGALDVETGIHVLEAIAAINLRLKTPTILITHNAVIAGMADRVLKMSDGRIVHDERNPVPKTPRELVW